MFIRRSFNEFLKLQSEVTPTSPPDWVIDWRWLSTSEDAGATFPSERSLIDCGTWAKPKKPRPA